MTHDRIKLQEVHAPSIALACTSARFIVTMMSNAASVGAISNELQHSARGTLKLTGALPDVGGEQCPTATTALR